MLDWITNKLRPYQFRGKTWMFDHFVPKEGIKECNVHGATVALDLSEHIQRSIYIGNYERQETNWVKAYLGKGDTFLDVGANVGYFSLLASRIVGNTGSVISIEPSRNRFEILEQTIARNSLSNVKLFNLGLGAVSEQKVLPDPLLENYSPSFFAEGQGENVRIVTLDELFPQMGVDHIDVLKMDVEGFEPYVLQGARSLLSQKKIKAILCEINEHWIQKAGYSPEEFHDKIVSMGFSACRLSGSLRNDPVINCLFIHKDFPSK